MKRLKISSIFSRPQMILRVVVLFLFAFALPRLLALDDHNPIGVTGSFEGVTTTGGSYNVLNHSATRQIDDIVVPGAIGKYGLKLTRYFNSRRGYGDGWGFEYFWGSINGKIYYPNGSVWDNSCTYVWNLPGPLGVSDWPTTWNGLPAFRLADGGTVVFGHPQWTSVATKIVDPYGQEINITLGANGRVTRVTEPGGRYLEFTYNGSGLITRVDAYDGQKHQIDYVIYTYSLISPGGNPPGPSVNCLTRVDYSDGTQAFYTYQDDNVPDHPYPCPCSIKVYPLLRTCRDVRYKGAMRHICYEYQDNGPHGAIIAERYSLNGSTNGPRVSRIDPPAPSPIDTDPIFDATYTEYRGDGPYRTFTYTDLLLHRSIDLETCPIYVGQAPQQFLQSYTDFDEHTTWLHYNANWYVDRVTDARGAYDGDPDHSTSYERGPAPPAGIGEILSVTHPAPDSSTIRYGYQDHRYVTSIIDERGNKTIHTRDQNTHHIIRTDYKNGNDALLAYETFDWCDQTGDPQCGSQAFGQLKRHRLKNGAYVHYRYDPRGLLVDKWEPTWNPSADENEPKTHYDYYGANDPVGDNAWIDRLKTETRPANSPYGYQASETYEYDKNGATPVAGRGLVTKTTHADGKYRSFGYDAYGNKLWEENELRKRTSYTYDSYNRVLTVKDPIGQITGRATRYDYAPTEGSTTQWKQHTTNSPYWITTPTQIKTHNVYDPNWRKTSTTAAFGTSSAATTWFHYDNVGNQEYVTDPRGSGSGDPTYTTTTDYDNRNRKWQVREPLGRTTQFFYDDHINLTRIIRADTTTETKAYDAMNRLITHTVPKEQGVNIVTQFQYYPYNVQSASLLKKVIDGENHAWQFEYDPAGLKTKLTYPDNSFQTWTYDDAHNLESRRTVANEIQNFAYDQRNRKFMEWWDGWPADGEWRAFGYDDANHLTLATNGTGNWWTNFIADVRRSYDDAGRLSSDQQKVYVNGVGNTKTVNYPTYDDDGRLTRMYVAGVNPAYDYTFSYDAMGRFEKIFATGSNNPSFQYYYDDASNERERDNLVTLVQQIYPRDSLNRMQYLDVKKGASTLGHEGYGYDAMSRLESVTREDNKQDSFTYYKNGELNIATYGGNPTPPPGSPTPPPGSPTPPPGSPTPPPASPTPTPLPGQVAEPTFNPEGFYYTACADNYRFNVTVATDTSGAQIRYTLDGSTPTASYGTPIPTPPGTASFVVQSFHTTTLKAIAYKSGMTNSNVHSDDYSFERDCGRAFPLDLAFQPPPIEPMAPDVSSITYTLDKAGNRTSVNGTGYSPNSINQYISVGGSPVTNGNDHEINAYGGFTYTYMRDQELTKVTAPSVPGFSYDLAYDALGRCVKRTVAATGYPTQTTWYIYDGDKPILEYNANGGLVGFNVYGKGIDEILKRGANGTDNQWHWYYFQQDHEGSVTHLTDYSGAILERYRYDAFGAPTIYAPNWTVRTGSSYNNRFLFTGREYDGAWVYEYRARLYHSGIGRFMGEDPKLFDAGDYNLFRYCHNDPIDFTDPMGTVYGSTAGQHLTPEILDDVYGKAMAAAQWVGSDLMHAETAAGAIGIGATGQFNATHVHWKETGNWTNRKIADHYVKEALYVRGKPAGGKTVGKVTAYANKDASVTAEVNVNWYVQEKYAGTNVVTRELEHVQNWRDWTNAVKTTTFLSFADKSYGSTEQLAGAVQEYLTPLATEFAARQWWHYDRGGGPHDLNYYPAQPAQVPEYDYTH